MGYTNYWYRMPKMDMKPFGLAVADCRAVCDALPIPLGDAKGYGDPVLSDDLIAFNGHRDTASRLVTDRDFVEWYVWNLEYGFNLSPDGDGSCETFMIDRETEIDDAEKKAVFRFCKTLGRPYDLAVQCCLIVFKQHFGSDFRVMSNGDTVDWDDAREWCDETLGYGMDFELDDDDEE